MREVGRKIVANSTANLGAGLSHILIEHRSAPIIRLLLLLLREHGGHNLLSIGPELGYTDSRADLGNALHSAATK